MFDLLKKKIGKFAGKVKQRIEQKQAAQEEEKPEEKTLAEPVQTPIEKPGLPEKKPVKPKPKKKPVKPAPELEEKPEEKARAEEPEPAAETLPEEKPFEPTPKEKLVEKPDEEKRLLKPKVSVKGRLKAAITGQVELQAPDLKDLLWELELALLEADVEQTTAEEICREIKQRLAGKKIARGKSVEETVKAEIGEILTQMMKTDSVDLVREAKAKKDKPYKILLLGPNGSGKTTSIAKLSHLLQSKNLKVIWAAGDTFRAASIEQLETHAKNLNIKVIKHQYGADPTAVAFDAVKSAQSKKIDVVLIDSAGRQETNRNLMRELQKIARVIKPDLKIYVGEAFTGQALLHQAKEYDKAVGIDAFILTKMDCDSKGGTTISLLYKTGKPILFVGTGQEYEDLEKFKPGFVLQRVIG